MSEHQGSSKAARLADSIKDAFTGRSDDERDAGWERREAAGTAEQDAGVPGQRHGDPDTPPLAGPGAGPGDAPGGRLAEDRTAPGGDRRAAPPASDPLATDPRAADPRAGDPPGAPGADPRDAGPAGHRDPVAGPGDPTAAGRTTEIPAGGGRGPVDGGGVPPGGAGAPGAGPAAHDGAAAGPAGGPAAGGLTAGGAAAAAAAAATTRGTPVRDDRDVRADPRDDRGPGHTGGRHHDATPGRGHDDLRDPAAPPAAGTAPGTPADPAAAAAPATGGSSLIPADRAREYQDRWTSLKGEFVDEPRRAVHGANALVGEILDEMEALFRRQRDDLEAQFSRDDASTEDLRQALTRYREFFDRLLSL